MPRKLRVEYEGAIYHVMNRGDRREPIFVDDQDRELFLETLGQACAKTDWQVHAYCLMGKQHHGEELNESDEQKAERLVGQMLRAGGWTEEELKHRPKGDIKKARMAARLRTETAMTWLWIAKRLEMGHWRTAANAVRACPRK